MKIAIFTYGSFEKAYGGQCKLLKEGLNKNNIQISNNNDHDDNL